MRRYIEYELLDDKSQSIIDQSVTMHINNKEAHESPMAANLLVIFAGSFLSLSLLFTIILNPTLHSSPSCYVLSLVISNLVILFTTLLEVLNDRYGLSFKPDVDYVICVTFEASILTLGVFSLDRYVTLCQPSSTTTKTMRRTCTAVKSVLTIWSMAAILVAMELNLYDHFDKDTIAQVFVFFTLVFLGFPLFVIVLLCCLVTLELRRRHAGTRAICALPRRKDVEDFLLLVVLTGGFLLTMVPYRIVKVIYHIDPSIPCQVIVTSICYTIVKMSTVITPIIYMATSCGFRRVFAVPRLSPRSKASCT